MKNLVINPVRIPGSELKVGQLYVDSIKKEEFDMCVLEFVEYDEVGDPYFKHISGRCIYGKEDGLVPFFRNERWNEVVSFEEQD